MSEVRVVIRHRYLGVPYEIEFTLPLRVEDRVDLSVLERGLSASIEHVCSFIEKIRNGRES